MEGGGPVYVAVNFMIRSISAINAVYMVLIDQPAPHCTSYRHNSCSCIQEYATQITFREEWTDDRLAFNNSALFPRLAEQYRDNMPDFVILAMGQQIWMPGAASIRENVK